MASLALPRCPSLFEMLMGKRSVTTTTEEKFENQTLYELVCFIDENDIRSYETIIYPPSDDVYEVRITRRKRT